VRASDADQQLSRAPSSTFWRRGAWSKSSAGLTDINFSLSALRKARRSTVWRTDRLPIGIRA
jgi:hypothetical protein